MKQELRYIKLFEAFESNKLSKTIGFINKKSKEKFLNDLKMIADTIDFPISEFNDKYFQYLPFKAALILNQNVEDVPCSATSEESYPGYGVSGETCQHGMIARKWGKGSRQAKCTICGGTGVKKRDSNPVKWVKFWFDKDGNYISVTGVDGQIRGGGGSGESIIDGVKFVSKKVENVRELRELPTGTILRIMINNIWTIGTVFRSGTNMYVIQSRHSGNDPGVTEWQKYGRYSWAIHSSSDYSGVPEILKPEGSDISDDGVNPYNWNGPLKLGYSKLAIGNGDVEGVISGAHFAIVLDFLELSKSEFSKKVDTTSKRGDLKSGAFKKADDVKMENIQRYIDELSKKVEISDDLKNFSMMLYRFLGLSYCGFYILKGRSSSDLNSLIDYTYRFASSESDYDKKSGHDNLVYLVKRSIGNNMIYNLGISDSIKKINVLIKDDVRKPIFDKMLELNRVISNRVKDFPVENIEDMEIIYQKIKSIREIWRNSSRFPAANQIYYALEYISDPERSVRNLRDYIRESDVDNVLRDLEKFKRIVERI